MPVPRPLLLLVAGVTVIAAFTVTTLDRTDGDTRTAERAAAAGPQPRPIAGGSFEASGVVHVPGTDRLLFVDDDREDEVFVMRLAPDGSQVGDAIPIHIPAHVTDPEGITTDGRYFYVVGSQSKRSGFDGDGLVRFSFDTSSNRVSGVERVQGLKAWLATNVPELRGTADRIGDDVVNVEGLAWDPRARRLLLGLRAPVDGGESLVIPIAFRDPAGSFTADNIRLDSAAIRIPLGGAGLRAIEHDSVTDGFVIVTGAALDDETRDFRVLEWDGTAGGMLRDVATFPRQLKPEGITRATLAGRSVRVIVFDVGSFLVLP